MTIPWILVALIGSIIVILALVVMLLKYRNKDYLQRDTDYKAFFIMGVIWIIIFGGYSVFRPDTTFSPMFTIGLVFLIIGAANRDKWGKQRRLTKQEVKWKKIALIGGVLALLLGVLVLTFFL